MSAQPDGGRAGAGLARAYYIGFSLSLVLTIVPFIAVMTGALSHGAAVFCVFAAATLQMLVQLRFFLHVDGSRAMHWQFMSLLFTFFIVFLFVGGSIWIMHSLHYRM